MGRTTFAILLVLAVLLPAAYVQPPWGYNQATRLDVLQSLFGHGTIAIDAYHENTGDKALVGGRYFSDKAPGTVALAAPAFAAAWIVLHAFRLPVDRNPGWDIAAWITTAGSVGLLSALAALAFFLLMSRLLDRRSALIAAFAVFLGSVPFPYATMLFSHAATVALITFALWATDRSTGILVPRKAPSFRHDIFAGLCLGMAVASEYTSALVVFGVWLCALLRNRTSALHQAAAACLPLLLIPGNNFLISGSPLGLPYEHVKDFPGMRRGFFGVTFLPDVSVMWNLLFSQYRGLFFWSPFLLLAFPGYRELRNIHRGIFFVFLLMPLCTVIAISSYAYWTGGWALGPRHIASIVPMVAVAAALGYRRYPRTGTALAALSILLTGMATLIDPMPPEGNLAPLVTLYLPAFLKGNFRPNLGTLLGLRGWLSLLALFVSFLLLAVPLYRSADAQSTGTSRVKR